MIFELFFSEKFFFATIFIIAEIFFLSFVTIFISHSFNCCENNVRFVDTFDSSESVLREEKKFLKRGINFFKTLFSK
jgi:hypothetical protein